MRVVERIALLVSALLRCTLRLHRLCFRRLQSPFPARLPNAWTELRPPIYPEGNYIAVYCSKCSQKNRQDDGWRYRDDPAQRAAEAAALARMGTSHMQLQMQMIIFAMSTPGGSMRRPPTFAHLTYQCNLCRDDRAEMREEKEEEQKAQTEEEESQQPQQPAPAAAAAAAGAQQQDAPVAHRTRARGGN